MHLAYFPLIVFDGFARMLIAAVQMTSRSTATANSKDTKKTIILRE